MSDLPAAPAPPLPAASDDPGDPGGPGDGDGAIDFASRELCPDGACTGVLGDDGRCRACGRQGAAPRAGTPEPAGDPAPREGQEGEGRAPPEGGALAEAATAPPAPDDQANDETNVEASDDFADRELCPDGACTGLIGPDGRCRECGQAATAPPGAPA